MATVEGHVGEADNNERTQNEDIFITDSENDVQKKKTQWNQAWKRNLKENLEI
jgi:hypothetical protein